MVVTANCLGDPKPISIEPYLRDIGHMLLALANGQTSEATSQLPRTSGIARGESDLPLLAKLAREEWRERSNRRKFIDADFLGEPGWDILLDLYASRFEDRLISVTSSCIASGVPPTTALRWIGQLIEGGLIERREDVMDQRRAWVGLTTVGFKAMSGYLSKRAEARFSRPVKF